MRHFPVAETKTLEEFVRREGSCSKLCEDHAVGMIRNFRRFDWGITGRHLERVEILRQSTFCPVGHPLESEQALSRLRSVGKLTPSQTAQIRDAVAGEIGSPFCIAVVLTDSASKKPVVCS